MKISNMDSLAGCYKAVEEMRAENLRKIQEEKIAKVKKEAEEIDSQIDDCISKTENEALISFYQMIKDIEVKHVSDFYKKQWLFNNGNLRTYEEMLEQSYRSDMNKYYRSGRYRIEATLVNIACFIVPCVIGTVFITLLFGKLWFLGIAPGLLVGLILSLIFMPIGHKANLSTLQALGVPRNDPQFQFELRELNIAKSAGPLIPLSILHNIKSGFKEITNVDSWKEMK